MKKLVHTVFTIMICLTIPFVYWTGKGLPIHENWILQFDAHIFVGSGWDNPEQSEYSSLEIASIT